MVSYFLNNPAKTCLCELKISGNTEIEHIFQSKAFFFLSQCQSPHKLCFSAFKNTFRKDGIQKSHTIIQMSLDRKQTLESTLNGNLHTSCFTTFKGTFRKDGIQKSHTIIQMSLDRKQILESTLNELKAKRNKLDK